MQLSSLFYAISHPKLYHRMSIQTTVAKRCQMSPQFAHLPGGVIDQHLKAREFDTAAQC